MDTAIHKASLWQIFGIFAKIGSFTIGGGYAMIPIIEKELQQRGWIGDDEIDDIVILAQSAPGLLAVNMAIFSGYKLRGLKGSIAATLGAIIPSFLIILLIAMVFTSFKENIIVQKIFAGLRPVAISLILVPAMNLIKKACKEWWTWLILFVTLFIVAFFKVSVIWVLLCLIAGTLGFVWLKEEHDKKK